MVNKEMYHYFVGEGWSKVGESSCVPRPTGCGLLDQRPTMEEGWWSTSNDIQVEHAVLCPTCLVAEVLCGGQ